MLEIERRQLITGLMVLVAAPAIVRAQSLMPVKVMQPYYRYFRVEYSYELAQSLKGAGYDVEAELTRILFKNAPDLSVYFVQIGDAEDKINGIVRRERLHIEAEVPKFQLHHTSIQPYWVRAGLSEDSV